MMNTFRLWSGLSLILATLFSATANSKEAYNPDLFYFMEGKDVAPWQMSINYGKSPIRFGEGESTKGSIVATPSEKASGGHAVRLVWSPKGVKNEWGYPDQNVHTLTVSNSTKTIDLEPVKMVAALVFDVKVNKAPRKMVELSMGCDWNWECRSTIPIKTALKKLPKKKWVSFPVPLQCFDDGKFNFSKVHTVFQMYTSDKMDIEIDDIRLAAFPQDKVSCPRR
ncbi:putative glycoside hydrolase [Agaribacterium sp. ZY112]|uniref:putative glycoside hydrolase n=1 Tax=Agaribacterium sp. ZY112 TaxID=3233574 RepID=UPI003523ED3A